MRFAAEGTYQVTIKKAVCAQPKWASPPAFDVCILVADSEGHEDWWRGEYSSTYGRGNFKDRTQAQITMETLADIGLPNNDLSQLPTLVGKQTTANVKASTKDGNTYYNVRYLGGGGGDEPEELNMQEVVQRANQMFGQPQQQTQQQAPQQQYQPQPQQGGQLVNTAAGNPNPFKR